MSEMLKEALDYIRRGWFVFPCREKPGTPYTNNDGELITPTEKMPYTAKGLHDATNDEDQAIAWWTKKPDALIGVNAELSGLFVVDIDRKHVDGLTTYSSWNINDSAGLQSTTPSGGMHVVFTGVGKSSTNAKTGIDTRGIGGYFIAPPSRIISGAFVGEYKRFNDWGVTPGVIPDGLLAKLFPDTTTEYVRGSSSPSADGEKKQLSRATLNFFANGAMQGERNHTLFKVTADFHGCGYTLEETREAVWPVCERIKISRSEFEQVLSHAYSKPRTSSIPDTIQEKIKEGGKNLATKITAEEQSVMEEVLIACLLVDNSLIAPTSDILLFDDFQVFKNRVIYKCIMRLYNAGMKVDYITVSSEVSKETDKISMDDISKMINNNYLNTDNVNTYSLIIKEKSSLRKVEAILDNKEKFLKSGNLIEVVSGLERAISDVAVYGGAKSTAVLNGQQAVDIMLEHNRKMASGEISQLQTGFSQFDNYIGGFYSNELIVDSAKSGQGKSALALSILNYLSFTRNKASAIFTLEMSTRETMCRLITQLTGISFKKVYQAKMSASEWILYKEALQKIQESHLYFDDSFGITVPEIRSKIRKLMDKNIELVVIDQLEQVKGYERQPAYIQLDKISYDIKALTKEFDIPIILNHQIRVRAGLKDGKETGQELDLQDLNQGGEKAADQVWMIQHQFADNDKKNILRSKINMAKNRNGAKITFPINFNGERMLFSDSPSTEVTVHENDDTDPDWAREEN